MNLGPSSTPLTAPLHEGRILIQASAGSGKTYAITTLVARLVVENDHKIDEILVVTFTKAATAELRKRIRGTFKAIENAKYKAATAKDQARDLLEKWNQTERLDKSQIKSRIELALLDLDRANILTIDSFCQRALAEFAFDTGFTFNYEVSGDGTEIVAGVVRDFWQRRFRNSSPILAKFLRKNRFMPDELANWYTKIRGIRFEEVRGVPKSIVEPAEAENECRAKFEEFIPVWHEHCGEFETIMQRSPALNLSYANAVVRRLPKIKQIVVNGDLPLEMEQFAETARYLSATFAAERCKGNKELPENELFSAFEILAESCELFLSQLKDWLRLTRKQLISHADVEIRRLVRDQKLFGYADFLIEMSDALEHQNGGRRVAENLRKRFPVALIDEFQDTNPTQARVFAGIYGGPESSGQQDETPAGKGALYIVGDPKQSIYQFRGADIFAYLAAKQGTESCLELGSNFRSTHALVDACNTVFSPNLAFTIPKIDYPTVTPERPAGDELEISGKREKPLQFWLMRDHASVETAREEAVNRTADDIIRMLNLAEAGKAKIGDTPLKAADIAVLVGTRADGRRIANALRRRGGRCVEIDDSSIFDSREARQMYQLLLALVHRDRQDYRRSALAGDLFGLESEDLLALIEEDDYWSYWAEKFDEWGKDWLVLGVGAMLRKIIAYEMKHWREVKAKPAMKCADVIADGKIGTSNLLNCPNGPRRLTNFHHLTELLQEAESEKQYSPAGVLAWLRRQITGQSQQDGTKEDAYTLRLDSDEDLVKIMTIHKCKGLEFPIVYLPFAWYSREIKNASHKPPVHYHVRDSGRFPAVLDLAPDEASRNQRELEEFGESVRLLYVALTRARERCIVTWTRITNNTNRELPPLAWLMHRDQKHDKILAKVGNLDTSKSAVPDSLAEIYASIKKKLRKVNRNDPKDRTDRIDFENEVTAMKQRCLGGIECRNFDKNAPAATISQAEKPEAELTPPREFKRAIRRIRQMTSYSDLAAEHEAPASPHRIAETGSPDHDQAVEDLSNDDLESEAQPQTLDAFHFPRGTRVGNCMHRIFEVHYEQPARALEDICGEQLQLAGIEAKWRTAALNMVENTLATELREPGHGGFRLADIKRRLCELQFHFPVDYLRRRELAAMLTRFGYPELLRQVPGEQAIIGFLNGFIDLTFEHEGRWYIADYKSNHLGDQASDYQSEHLPEAMRHHSYQLQYLIYLLALHRYLGTRLRDYDYERHMGGVFYLFLRGMDPATGMSGGVWFDRPEKACIEALDNFMKSAGA